MRATQRRLLHKSRWLVRHTFGKAVSTLSLQVKGVPRQPQNNDKGELLKQRENPIADGYGRAQFHDGMVVTALRSSSDTRRRETSASSPER